MVLHVALRSEALTAALRAGKGTLVAVDALVDFQVLLLRKGFGAAGERTAERLGSLVKMNVGLEPNLSTEGLATVWKRASEYCFSAGGIDAPGVGLLGLELGRVDQGFAIWFAEGLVLGLGIVFCH